MIAEIPAELKACVIVVDNGSTDATAAVARAAGAEVVSQPVRGYGRACLAGLAVLDESPPDVVVILDADHSDYPEDMTAVVTPILEGVADLVCGSRVALAERGSVAASSPSRQPSRDLAHTLVARLRVRGHGSVSSHSLAVSATARNVRSYVRLECRNAGQSVATGSACCRGVGALSSARRALEDQRHHQGDGHGWWHDLVDGRRAPLCAGSPGGACRRFAGETCSTSAHQLTDRSRKGAPRWII